MYSPSVCKSPSTQTFQRHVSPGPGRPQPPPNGKKKGKKRKKGKKTGQILLGTLTPMSQVRVVLNSLSPLPLLSLSPSLPLSLSPTISHTPSPPLPPTHPSSKKKNQPASVASKTVERNTLRRGHESRPRSTRAASALWRRHSTGRWSVSST